MLTVVVPLAVVAVLVVAAAIFACCGSQRQLRSVVPISPHRGFHPR
jgi:hypothetical protein